MIPSLELFQILRPHVITVSGVPECIFANQNAPAPPGDYAALQIRHATEERGQANIKKRNLPDDRVEGDVRAQMMMTCVLEFYRGRAHEYAEQILQIGKRQDVTWPLFKEGIGIRNTSGILDLTALQSSNYEPRARIELYLWLEASSKYIVNNILGASASVQYETGDVLQSISVDLREV